MDKTTYESLPGQMEVRVVRVRVAVRGFRTRVLDLVTTLLDAELYRKKDLADLYRRRWEAEMSHPDYPSSDGLYRRDRAA